MKKKLNFLVMLVCLLALGLGLMGCPIDDTGGDGGDITYTVTPSGTPTTNTLNFTFSSSVDLTADDITITNGTGSATKGSLTGSGTSYSLGVTTNTAGTISVSINKSGIESGSKNITIVKDTDSSDITYTVTPSGTPTTNTIVLTFSSAISDLTVDNIVITDGTGNATKGILTGSGTSYSLGVTTNTAGTISVSINKTGIESGTKPVTLIKGEVSGDITYMITPDGDPTTTSLVFTFNSAVSGLTVGDITLTDETGNATKGSLTGNGTSYSLGVTTNTAGTISVSINKTGIESGAKSVTLIKGEVSGDITYFVLPAGTPTTTSLYFSFYSAVSGLTEADITITNGTGSATKGSFLTESGLIYSLGITTNTAGTISVSINKSGIESGSKNVTLVKGGGGGTTYTVTYYGNENTGGTAPTDTNSPYVSGASVTVLGNTGNLVKSGNTFTGWNTAANGSGTTYQAGNTFPITGNTVLYAKWTAEGGGNDITYTVVPSGDPTNFLAFTFSSPVSGLLASDITITSGTGSATKGSLSNLLGTWSLRVGTITAGTVTVSINKAGIESGTKTVTLVKTPLTIDQDLVGVWAKNGNYPRLYLYAEKAVRFDIAWAETNAVSWYLFENSGVIYTETYEWGVSGNTLTLTLYNDNNYPEISQTWTCTYALSSNKQTLTLSGGNNMLFEGLVGNGTFTKIP
jgi:hypothetical protein